MSLSSALRQLARTFAIASLVTGCGSPAEVGLLPSVAVVYGTVTSESGRGASDVHVSAFIRPLDDCEPQPELGAPSGTSRTHTQGEYSVRLHGPHVSEMEVCILVRAIPPTGSSFEETVVIGGELLLRHQTLTPPIDSLRVDLTLEPSS